MKLLFITDTFPPAVCGIGDYTYRLTNEIYKLNNDISVLTKIENENHAAPFKVHNTVKSWSPLNFSKIKKHIIELNPDAIHIQYPNIKSIGYYLLPFLIKVMAKYRGKLVISIHEHTHKTFIGKLANLTAVLFANVVIISEEQYQKSFRYFNSNIQSLRVLSNIPKASLTNTEKQFVKQKLNLGNKKLVSYFGFIVDHKGVDLLFEVCNPDEHYVLLIGDTTKFQSDYSKKIEKTLLTERWKNSAKATGFISENDVANFLAVSDVCLFPFKKGVGERNASFNAALIQNTFIITTHSKKEGYDSENNVFYTKIDDVKKMQEALRDFENYSPSKNNIALTNSWSDLAKKHLAFYSRNEN